jgi:tetratricopeptide (TPR) repeat protein
MVVAAGRNDPCPCGSGRKFKKCCGLVATPPPHADALVALFHAGHFAEMELGARHLLARDPQAGVTWKLLGIALSRQGKDALPASRKAADLLPADPDAHHNLGITLQASGQHAEAAKSFGRAIEILPTFAEAHRNLGSALQAQGEYAKAADCARRALALHPASAAAHNNLGNALWSQGRADAAVPCFERALELNPQDAAAHNNLGNALRDLERFDAAAASYGRAIALSPGFAEAHSNLGILYRNQGRLVEAEAACQRSLELDARGIPAILLLASLRADGGRFGEAEALCRRAISIDPHCIEAWAALPAYRRMGHGDAAWLQQARSLVQRPLPARREALLRYAMGKYCDDVAEYDAAFDHYRRANELMRAVSPAYDRDAMERFVDKLIAAPAHLGSRSSGDSSRVVFIVGMPRSGTTLAEQILASHDEVFGAGELKFWTEAKTASGDVYLAHLPADSIKAARVIDKMPYNFLHLGMIHAALPQAKIIHVHRDPVDTCLSIYFQDFGDTQPYARDLGDLAHYYDQYRRIMRHWIKVLPPEAILDLAYEDLVADQERWSRAMVRFIGLDWDPGCLEFERTERAVMTASFRQVRQKMHARSVGRSRHYEQFVTPLLGLRQTA